DSVHVAILVHHCINIDKKKRTIETGPNDCIPCNDDIFTFPFAFRYMPNKLDLLLLIVCTIWGNEPELCAQMLIFYYVMLAVA
ncbi:hypothetical protein ACJX0J_039318, partial [Zea mays]